LANLITISRFPLLLIYLLMLYLGNESVRLIAIPLLFIALMFDSLDGIVARRTGNVSLSGSVLDIAADRVYELVLWVSFADLRLIPVAIPLIVITRTTLTDAIRSIGVRDGKAPFEQHETRLGTFIVGSRWMRLIYGLAKVVSFCGLTLAIALSGYPEGSASFAAWPGVLKAFQVTSWIAVGFCVVRGSPVILGAIKRSLRKS
jgi:phosphatidylglycerophosphate synthase